MIAGGLAWAAVTLSATAADLSAGELLGAFHACCTYALLILKAAYGCSMCNL